GKRYRREDEIGTPFSICVDFDTAEDKSVTIRDRDTMEQVRIPIAEVREYIENRLRF
ncbi:MAG: glycine--tRNA ligase, partial [Mogibacterium sp.]|nr:glycine--tRNA ligase [Mogibacterium sp.]